MSLKGELFVIEEPTKEVLGIRAWLYEKSILIEFFDKPDFRSTKDEIQKIWLEKEHVEKLLPLFKRLVE